MAEFLPNSVTGDLVLAKSPVPDALESIDARLSFVEALCKRIVVQTKREEIIAVKSYHWVTVVVVLFVAYLIGVKYPSIGQSALSKVGL